MTEHCQQLSELTQSWHQTNIDSNVFMHRNILAESYTDTSIHNKVQAWTSSYRILRVWASSCRLLSELLQAAEWAPAGCWVSSCRLLSELLQAAEWAPAGCWGSSCRLLSELLQAAEGAPAGCWVSSWVSMAKSYTNHNLHNKYNMEVHKVSKSIHHSQTDSCAFTCKETLGSCMKSFLCRCCNLHAIFN